MTPTEKDLHRKMLEAFNEYININLRWEKTRSYMSSVKCRKALRKLIDNTYLRYREIDFVRKGILDKTPVVGKEMFRDLCKKHKKSRLDRKNENNT